MRLSFLNESKVWKISLSMSGESSEYFAYVIVEFDCLMGACNVEHFQGQFYVKFLFIFSYRVALGQNDAIYCLS